MTDARSLFGGLVFAATILQTAHDAAAQDVLGKCGKSVIISSDSGAAPNTYEIVSTNPLTIVDSKYGNRYSEQSLSSFIDTLKGYVGNCAQGVPGWCQSSTVQAQRKTLSFLTCATNAGGGSDRSIESESDNVTPQVPGCPKYLRKSMVQWRQVGNPQLNTWEIRNISNKTLKVTFREAGANRSPDTLPPGQSTQVGLASTQVPPYVVRDFNELFAFDRANASNGKTLQCDLAIRPR